MRLNRFLAAAGIGSRRHCDELIAAGPVTINGRVCTDFSAQPAERDHVKVGRKLVRAERPLSCALHKPAGFVSTRSDPNARDTIFDLFPAKLPRLFNIGRLDAQSEGLLLLTNDGDLAQKLTHPRYRIEKEYEVTLDRPLGSGAGGKVVARDLSRWATRPDRAGDGHRSYAFAGCLTAGNQSANPANVLRHRLRSGTSRANTHWAAAAGRFAARTLAAADCA